MVPTAGNPSKRYQCKQIAVTRDRSENGATSNQILDAANERLLVWIAHGIVSTCQFQRSSSYAVDFKYPTANKRNVSSSHFGARSKRQLLLSRALPDTHSANRRPIHPKTFGGSNGPGLVLLPMQLRTHESQSKPLLRELPYKTVQQLPSRA
jgi:hypothetical protein